MGEPSLDNLLEYSYTLRNEFTSEIYKVEVRNLGIFGIGEFKKFLKKQFSLVASKIKSPNHRNFAYVCFRNQKDLEKALRELDGFVWKGRALKVSKANAIPDPLIKRRVECQSDGKQFKKPRTCAEATCPFYNLSYEEQLSRKNSEMKDVLENFGRELAKVNNAAKVHYKNNLPCEYKGIKAAPKIEEYRNKSEFAIGKNIQGEIVVGFRLSSYVNGSVEVGGLAGLPHIPQKVKKAAYTFEEYLRKTEFEVFNPEHNSGHFKQLSVRYSEYNSDIMLIFGVYSANLTEGQLKELKDEVKNFYENYDKAEFVCNSLYYQDLKRRESGQLSSPVQHLYGATHIYDKIHGIKFRISPLAFFQVNTKSAEILYQEARKLAGLKLNTTVFDICCGIGSIGLYFASCCKQVFGVEIISEAINDAEFNANENEIRNCKFFVGNADNYIQSMIKEAVYSYTSKENIDLVAVVDPPRAGLHNRSIQALRTAQELKRIVYISCSPKSAQRNWIDLARPESKNYKGKPFLPKCALAVDMFPHTSHTEMVLLFERLEENKEIENEKESIHGYSEIEENNSMDKKESAPEFQEMHS